MIYGTAGINLVHDSTDLIGIRTLIQRQYWMSLSAKSSQADLDAQKPSPPGVPGGLMLMGEQTLRERGKYATYWTFQGINGDGKSVTFKNRTNSLDYGFEPGFSQVPIQVNESFPAMMDRFEGYPSNDGTTVIWPPTLSSQSGGGSALSKSSTSTGATNPMFGIQSFFEMDGVYRFRYASQSLPGSLEDGVGYISSGLPGTPPAVSDGRTWLKAPTAWERKGVVYDITEFYWLSRRGGWPVPVYQRGYFGNSGGGSSGGSDGGLGSPPSI